MNTDELYDRLRRAVSMFDDPIDVLVILDDGELLEVDAVEVNREHNDPVLLLLAGNVVG